LRGGRAERLRGGGGWPGRGGRGWRGAAAPADLHSTPVRVLREVHAQRPACDLSAVQVAHCALGSRCVAVLDEAVAFGLAGVLVRHQADGDDGAHLVEDVAHDLDEQVWLGMQECGRLHGLDLVAEYVRHTIHEAGNGNLAGTSAGVTQVGGAGINQDKMRADVILVGTRLAF
jgi:hypothetical protein